MAKPTQDSRPSLLVIELWGLGDLALAVPFLRAASGTRRVTLAAKPHALPLVERFAPAVELVPLIAPWTAFRGKYRLLRWPWAVLVGGLRELRGRNFEDAVSARSDPRDHLLMRTVGARYRHGFPRTCSALLLNRPLQNPSNPHRAERWSSLAVSLGLTISSVIPPKRNGKRIVIHTGAGQLVRIWPIGRYAELARRLRQERWEVEIIDDSLGNIPKLLELLDSADRFIGNDSGPGHLSALLGVPTFTIFGPQLPELFAPRHPAAAWIEGAPCPYKPCFDYCRFAEARCITSIDIDAVFGRIMAWLAR